ncbi:MAG: hypothetical protein HC933_09990 [Pleurocapsa sp. SU_196_0]|nr:hypothetical protein [Pleurocapsa sp. SU_196_0]
MASSLELSEDLFELSPKAIDYIENKGKLLKKALDWISIDECLRAGWEIFPFASGFLDRYGGWEIRARHTYFQSVLPECESFSSNLFTWMKIMKQKLFPIGVGESEEYYLISEYGSIFEADECAQGMLKLGDTIAQGIDSILWFDTKKPDMYCGENTTFWNKGADFPPPFLHEKFFKG